MNNYSGLTYGESQYGFDSEYTDARILEKNLYRNPFVKTLFAWGGNYTRSKDITGVAIASITGSSENAGNEYENAIDGLRPHKKPEDTAFEGWWEASDTSLPQYLDIDLGKVRTINKIKLYHHHEDALKDFNIQYKDTPSDYLSFDGVDDQVSVAGDIDLTAPFTLECRFKLIDSTTVILMSGNNWEFGIASGNPYLKVYAKVGIGSPVWQTFTDAGHTCSLDTLYHLVVQQSVVLSLTQLDFHLDDAIQTYSLLSLYENQGNTNDIYFGRNMTTYSKVKIYKCAIYTDVTMDVTDLYNNVEVTTGRVAEWRFLEGEGRDLFDIEDAYDGVIQGATWGEDTVYLSSYWHDAYSEEDNTEFKTIIDFDTPYEAQVWRLNITAMNTTVEAKVQEIEFYYFQDESSRLVCSDDGVPQYSVRMSKNEDVNALPEPYEFSLVLSNADARFTPYNKLSEIFGDLQIDGFGDIRAGTPVIIYAGFKDEEGVKHQTELFYGQIGNDDNPATPTGITFSTDEMVINITGKDFTNKLRTTKIPAGVPILESYEMEDLLYELCYMANIPKCDVEIEATGINIPFAIFSNDRTVYEEVEDLRSSINGKLVTAEEETIKFVNVIAYRSWEQSTQSEYELGIYNSEFCDVVSESSKMKALPMNTKTQWEAGTVSGVDTTTYPNEVILGNSADSKAQSSYNATVTMWSDGASRVMERRTVDSGMVITNLKFRMRKEEGSPVGTGYLIVRNTTTGVTGTGTIDVSTIGAEGLYGANLDVGVPINYGDVVEYEFKWEAGGTTTDKIVVRRQTPKADSLGQAYYRVRGSGSWITIANSNMTYSLTGFKYDTGGYIITKTIDNTYKPNEMPEICLQLDIPVGCSVKVYGETKDSDAGWGSPTLIDTLTAGTNKNRIVDTTALTPKEFMQFKFEFFNSTGYEGATPRLTTLYFSVFFATQEHDMTVGIVGFGALLGSLEGYESGENGVDFRVFTYATPATAYDDLQAVAVENGAKITAGVKQYVKVGIRLWTKNYLKIPKLTSLTINWLITLGIMNRNLYTYEYTGENKRIKSLTYDIGNPRCNECFVNANPYILQAIGTIWTFDETPTIANGDVLVIYAYYSKPTRKDSGGNIRTLDITISASAGSVDDGSSATINGCDVAFSSGANIGTVTITNSSGGARTVDALTIDARELWTSVEAQRKTRVKTADDISIDLYGNKRYQREIESKYIASMTQAQNLSDIIVDNDKYVKSYITSMNLMFSPNLTLQDFFTVVHPAKTLGARQYVPTYINHQGFDTMVQAEET